jgi:hypothetical protein
MRVKTTPVAHLHLYKFCNIVLQVKSVFFIRDTYLLHGRTRFPDHHLSCRAKNRNILVQANPVEHQVP